MAKSLIKEQYPLITSNELHKIHSVIDTKCSEYYFIDFLRCSNGNVDDAISFFFLDEKLRAIFVQYLMRFEIQVKSDFALLVQQSTRSKKFWQVNKYYTPTARVKRPGKRTIFYETKKNIQSQIDRINPKTPGPQNFLAMYSISYGSFITLFRYIDTNNEQVFISRYTSHLSNQTFSMLVNYLDAIRVLRNRCAHGNHIISIKFVNQLNKYRKKLVYPPYSPLPGTYLTTFEALIYFLIKQLNCGNEIRKKIKRLLLKYSTILTTYQGRHSLSYNTVAKIL